MASAPATWIFDKADYSKHRTVTLPTDPLPPLGPSSLRLQTRLIGLTTNNQTYARLGHLLGWWDVYPPPKNAPAPYNDREKYARIAGWGYAEIIESTVPEIPVGNMVYGYLAVSTAPEDICIKPASMKNQVFVVDEHRKHLWTIYNRYQVYPPLAELEKAKTQDFLGWDCLMQVLFGTAYNLNVYGFAWKDEYRIHPGGSGAWTAEDANLKDTMVVCLNASGKTGISFAYTLRNNRPREHQPRTILGIGSSASRAMLETSGYYDKVLLNSDAQLAKSLVEESKPRRVLLFDFGARSGATAAWREALSSLPPGIPYVFVAVGGEVKVMSPEEIGKRLQERIGVLQVNANVLREKGIEAAGFKYFERFYRDWEEFERKGAIPGCKLVWGKGVEGWKGGWERLCTDEGNATEGLVYRF